PDGVGVRHASSLRLGQWQALLQGRGEAPAGGKRARDLLQESRLVAEGEHRLEQEHHLERRRRERWDAGDLEAARKAAGALCSHGDRVFVCIDTEVVAAELLREKSTRPSDSATEVEDGDAGTDARALRERQNLGPTDEALLLDVLTA